MRCPHCKRELVGYILISYPYERGYKCKKCDIEWSHLQIRMGALKNKKKGD